MKKNNHPSNEDALLIMGIQKGHQQCLSVLYDKYAPALMGIICKIVPEATIAEEILQKTFQLAWQQIKSLRFTSTAVFTWLLQLARHLAIENIKSVQLQNPASNDYVCIPAEDNAVQNSFSATYQKPIFDLLYFKGLCYQQVALQLKIPVEEVKINFRLFIKTWV